MGVSVRFETMKSSETEILFCTDGSLLRELLEDPLLLKYSAVMVGRGAERSLNTDVLLGLLKKVTRKRKELRVIVSSATIDAEAFREFFRAEKEELELELEEEEEEKEKKKKGNDDGNFLPRTANRLFLASKDEGNIQFERFIAKNRWQTT